MWAQQKGVKYREQEESPHMWKSRLNELWHVDVYYSLLSA